MTSMPEEASGVEGEERGRKETRKERRKERK